MGTRGGIRKGVGGGGKEEKKGKNRFIKKILIKHLILYIGVFANEGKGF